MEVANKTAITIEALVAAPIEKVWAYWNEPVHVTQWNSASPDWHSPRAENDLRAGGKFNYRMEAKDGSFGFDFEGVYHQVVEHKLISYSMPDGRKVSTTFSPEGNFTKVVETFDPESENPLEMQRAGWQAILNNFKQYTEADQ